MVVGIIIIVVAAIAIGILAWKLHKKESSQEEVINKPSEPIPVDEVQKEEEKEPEKPKEEVVEPKFKDGDILCTYECYKPKIVFILKGTPKKHYALRYHCYYNIMYPYFESDSKKGCLAPNDEDLKLATKEQRDLLFQKMEEAGYEWSDKDRKLIKIVK